MSQSIINPDVVQIVARDLGLALEDRDNISYQELLELVAQQIAEFLDKRPETLFSLLYRLDVDQEKVDDVINQFSETPKNILLAELIILRQIKRIETKLKYKQEDIDGWEKF